MNAPIDTGVADDLPNFENPWHAEAFGTMLAVFESGLFPWSEWVEIFSMEIRAHPAQADEHSQAAYYRQWLAALETILVKHRALTPDEIAETSEHVRRSFLNTPHGKPIVFSRQWPADPTANLLAPGQQEADHDHSHRHTPNPRPVAVSAAIG